MTRLLALVLFPSFVLASCAPRALRLPQGPGSAFPDYAQAFERATAPCRGIRTLTAEIALSGRVARQRLRGRVLAGFERPDALRLEAVAPFGSPVFIFVARGGGATLLLPRDDRVLQGSPPAAVLEALAGIALRPEELRALLTGCVSDTPRPRAGREYEDGWRAVDLDEGWAVYLKSAPGPEAGLKTRPPAAIDAPAAIVAPTRLVAATRGPLLVEYRAWQDGLPSEVRIRSTPTDGAHSELTLVLSQVSTNVDLGAEAFTLEIPRDVQPLSLEELRHAGPLGAR